MPDLTEPADLPVAGRAREYFELARQFREADKERPDRTSDPEAWDVVAVTQGIFAGTMMQPGVGSLIALQDVDVPQDPDGNYLNYAMVTTASGIRIKVTFEPQPR